MNPQFNEVYETLYQGFGRQLSDMEQALAQDAKQVINEAIDELNLSEIVRPDAKHFLLVNFHQFILVPAYLSSESLSISRDQVVASLRTDARTILRASEDLARQRETREISGHIVLDSINNSWGILKSTFYEFWDC